MVALHYTAHSDYHEHHLKEYRDEIYRDDGNTETWLRHRVAHHKHEHNLEDEKRIWNEIEMKLKKKFLDNLEYLKWIWNEFEIWIQTQVQVWKKMVLESKFTTDKDKIRDKR